jgi:PKD repeat protein
LPPICQIATQAPTAGFSPNSASSCITTIAFTDSSSNTPQAWFWDFGDGGTSTLQNPVHTYNTSGVYTVKLVVTNNIGQDSTTRTVTIALPSTPSAADVEVCAGDTAYVTAVASGTPRWRNVANAIIYSGDTLTVPNTGTIATYYVENVVAAASVNVGAANNNIGTGTYHGSGFHGALNFTANRSLEIVSAWVDADGAGPRTFIVASGSNNNGTPPAAGDIVDQVTINLVNGPQRVNLNLSVPAAGNYNIGANNADMYRNRAGAAYPYTAPGYMSITSSSSTSAPNDFYYYLYDIEVRDPACVSAQDTVTVSPVVSDFTFSSANTTVTFTDASVDATSWSWDFGDGNTSTQQSPVHTYAAAGTYNVSLTINNGACTSTQSITITIISIDQLGQDQLSMALLPNPSQAQTTLTLGRELEEEVQVRLLDVTGKVCQQYTLPQGQKSLSLDVSDLPSAVYLVQLKGKNFSATQKLVVE